MDPQQVLLDVAKHLAAGEQSAAAEALSAYWTWRRRGGYEPPDGDHRAAQVAQLARRLGRSRYDDEANGEPPMTLADAIESVLAALLTRRETAAQ